MVRAMLVTLDIDNDGVLDALAWTQIGSNLIGDEDADSFGFAVAASGDGKTIAVGGYAATGEQSRSGIVRVFQLSDDDWVQLGTDIDGEAGGDQFGHAVSISKDGLTVAVGAPSNDGAGSDSGHVRVFAFVLGDWVQIGADIDGEGSGDQFGYSVSLSDDGTYLAVGEVGYDDVISGASNVGRVRVFQREDDSWNQFGTDIIRASAGAQVGYSVALSGNGEWVAVGGATWTQSSLTSGQRTGMVRLYGLLMGWQASFDALHGDANDYLGSALHLPPMVPC